MILIGTRVCILATNVVGTVTAMREMGTHMEYTVEWYDHKDRKHLTTHREDAIAEQPELPFGDKIF